MFCICLHLSTSHIFKLNDKNEFLQYSDMPHSCFKLKIPEQTQMIGIIPLFLQINDFQLCILNPRNTIKLQVLTFIEYYWNSS